MTCKPWKNVEARGAYSPHEPGGLIYHPHGWRVLPETENNGSLYLAGKGMCPEGEIHIHHVWLRKPKSGRFRGSNPD
jgi:hypothetical protein